MIVRRLGSKHLACERGSRRGIDRANTEKLLLHRRICGGSDGGDATARDRAKSHRWSPAWVSAGQIPVVESDGSVLRMGDRREEGHEDGRQRAEDVSFRHG